MVNGQDPISAMMQSMQQTIEPLAPHNMIPQLLAPLTAVFQGGSERGIIARRDMREGITPEERAKIDALTLKTKIAAGTETGPLNSTTGRATYFY